MLSILCATTNRRGTRCAHVAGGPAGFCSIHAPDRGDRGVAINSRGDRCRLPPVKDGFCEFHQEDPMLDGQKNGGREPAEVRALERYREETADELLAADDGTLHRDRIVVAGVVIEREVLHPDFVVRVTVTTTAGDRRPLRLVGVFDDDALVDARLGQVVDGELVPTVDLLALDQLRIALRFFHTGRLSRHDIEELERQFRRLFMPL